MKHLIFDYDMQIDYSLEVSKCYYTIKCFPENTARQTIRDVEVEFSPPTIPSKGRDGLGNLQYYGVEEEAHDSFRFHISGNAVTGQALYESLGDDSRDMIYHHPHGLNVPGPTIKQYFQLLQREMNLQEKMPLEQAEGIMHCLHRDFIYSPGLTDTDTTAEEAFSLGRGVCQDYAHIFIALLHMAGISARYVTGLIVGEGASHAWVEVLQNGKWYGLDPTNDCMVRDQHIRIGAGRDAKDCMINRGIMHGGGMHTQTINVSVRSAG